MLTEVRPAVQPDHAEDGVDLVCALAGLGGRPRALAPWSWNRNVSELASGALEEIMQVLEVAPAEFHSAISQRSLFAHGIQRCYFVNAARC